MMDIKLILLSCGQKKRTVPTIAGRMYTGPYHVALRSYAESLPIEGRQVYILSAKFGLLEYVREIEPYDLRLGQPGSIDATTLQRQAFGAGLLSLLGHEVMVLGGKEYVQLARQVWPGALAPLEGLGGMGTQIGILTRNHGRWPSNWEV